MSGCGGVRQVSSQLLLLLLMVQSHV